ncbi:MAG: hypothetical protein R2780_00960 [Crocinitomicaceae bacterium]
MIRNWFLIIFLILISSYSQGKESLLDRKITIDIKSTPVKVILKAIEDKGKVKFSYNPDFVDEERIVSLSIKDQTIRYGLSLIFDRSIRFKEVGKHIVLLKEEDREIAKACRKERTEYVFSGFIFDKRTGDPIAGASVYEVDGHYATLSDNAGEYKLVVPGNCSLISIYFKKKGYKAEVIVVEGNENGTLITDIDLEPIEEDISKIENQKMERIEVPIEQKGISTVLISEETIQHSENLEDVEDIRLAQISLIPRVSIGSNLSTNALIYNRLSLNVLAGYSKGVKGAEVGSILNLTRENVIGAQVGGIANLVGGDVIGAQVGGISNLVQGNVTGVQVAGVSTIMKRDLKGVQVSGVASIVRGGFTGLQLSGVGNITWKKSTGAQISGVYNMVKDSLIGGQISGVANMSNGGVNFIQVAGISNFAHKNNGLQVSAIQNFSRENHGLQIGLVNSSIRGNGVAIGLFNFVKEGYHKTEVSANEIFALNLVFKTGTQRFYNTYNFGVRPGFHKAYGLGMGFGSYLNMGEKFMLSMDVTGQMVFENEFKAFKFAQLYKFSPTIDFKLAKWVTVFAGPSINVSIQAFQSDNGFYDTNIAFNPFYKKVTSQDLTQAWVGGQIGFRF